MCAYTDNSSFRCGSSHYLIQVLAGFPYVVRPFARSRRSLRYPATSFPRILCWNQQAKELLLAIVKKRCKVVVARATYFISLKDVSFASENQRSKHCGHSRDRTCDPFLRGEMLYSTELCVHVGTGNATYQSRFGRCRQTKDFKPTLTGNILTLTFNNLQTNHYLLLFSYFLVHPMFLQHIIYVCFQEKRCVSYHAMRQNAFFS